MSPVTLVLALIAWRSTFKAWATALKRDYSQRAKLVRPTSAKDFLDWPTAAANNSGSNQGGAVGRVGPVRPNLEGAAKGWATARSNDPEKRGDFDLQNPRNGLPAQALAWATAKTPTGGPESRSSKASRGAGGEDLQTQALGWATIRGSDGEKGGPNQRDGSGSAHLPAEVVAWASRPDGSAIPKTGSAWEYLENSGPLCLNPFFVEWLMGFPIGWTVFAVWETDRFRSWQREHSLICSQLTGGLNG